MQPVQQLLETEPELGPVTIQMPCDVTTWYLYHDAWAGKVPLGRNFAKVSNVNFRHMQ